MPDQLRCDRRHDAGARAHLQPEVQDAVRRGCLYDMMGTPGESHTTMKWSTQVATPDEIKRVEQLLDEGLALGAIGVVHVRDTWSAAARRKSRHRPEARRKVRAGGLRPRPFSGQMPPTSGLLGFLEMMAPRKCTAAGSSSNTCRHKR